MFTHPLLKREYPWLQKKRGMFYSRPFPLHASFRVSTSASLLRTCCRAASFNAGASFTIMQNGDLSVQLQSRNNECERPKASPSHKHLGHVVHRSPALCFHSTSLRTIRTHVWRDAGLSATGRRLLDTRVFMKQGCRVADVPRLQLEVRWSRCSAGWRSCSPSFCTVFFSHFCCFSCACPHAARRFSACCLRLASQQIDVGHVL